MVRRFIIIRQGTNKLAGLKAGKAGKKTRRGGKMENVIKKRTKKPAPSIIAAMEKIPNKGAGYDIKHQLFRSGTSVGANYRAACIAGSKADFISKLGIA